MSANRQKTDRKAPRTAFKPGQSGNPAGRPKQTAEQRDALEAIRALAPETADTLRQILEDPKASYSARLQCVQIILERTYGKPDAHVELTQPDFTALHEAFAAMKAGKP